MCYHQLSSFMWAMLLLAPVCTRLRQCQVIQDTSLGSFPLRGRASRVPPLLWNLLDFPQFSFLAHHPPPVSDSSFHQAPTLAPIPLNELVHPPTPLHMSSFDSPGLHSAKKPSNQGLSWLLAVQAQHWKTSWDLILVGKLWNYTITCQDFLTQVFLGFKTGPPTVSSWFVINTRVPTVNTGLHILNCGDTSHSLDWSPMDRPKLTP